MSGPDEAYLEQIDAVRRRFGRIGLALSGGGYRAAAFHLGALDLLDRLGLLRCVTMLSTVSGGTFTGMVFALSQVSGEAFGVARDRFYRFMRDEDLLGAGLKRLGQGRSLAPSKRRSLITAMAQVYADKLLSRPDGSPWLLGDLQDAEIPLKEAVFNATELRHGEAFRFQRSAGENAINGSHRIVLPPEIAREVRMADVAAASSSFPGGFEPLVFPHDFCWPDGRVPESLDGDIHCSLSDGGVFDNQGIESLLAADDRSPEDLDLFIISDADRQTEDYYSLDGPARGRLSLRLAGWIMVTLILTHAVSAAILVWLLFQAVVHSQLNWAELALGIVLPLGLTSSVALGLSYVLYTVRQEALARVPELGIESWGVLKGLTLRETLDLAEIRLRCLFAITSGVFSNRIRSLVYGMVYRDPRYNGKRVSNLIVHLKTPPGDEQEAPRMDGIAPPSAALREVADRAANVGTTLWFESEQPLADLLASGRFTLCYNLMKYLLRTQGSDVDAFDPASRALWDRLQGEWAAFNDDPFHLPAGGSDAQPS